MKNSPTNKSGSFIKEDKHEDCERCRIKNSKVRDVFYQIAEETEEDYQKLIQVLESFGVRTIRPTVSDNYKDYLSPESGKISPPPMTPRDYCAMIGNKFYFNDRYNSKRVKMQWDTMAGTEWPARPTTLAEFDLLPDRIKQELKHNFNIQYFNEISYDTCYDALINDLEKNNNVVLGEDISSGGRAKIYVMHSDEAGEIVRKTSKTVE
jgi:hypothetical protein